MENSDSMQKLQQEKLQPLVDGNKWNIAWSSSIEEVNPSEDQYTMIIAHEFFDALPFHLLEVRIMFVLIQTHSYVPYSEVRRDGAKCSSHQTPTQQSR